MSDKIQKIPNAVNFYSSSKETSTEGTVTFTFPYRGAAILMIQSQNARSSVYAIVMSDGGTMTAQLLAGQDMGITNTGRTVNVPLGTWANATMISNIGIY